MKEVTIEEIKKDMPKPARYTLVSSWAPKANSQKRIDVVTDILGKEVTYEVVLSHSHTTVWTGDELETAVDRFNEIK